MKKRVLSMLLVLVMVLGMVPVMAGAATATPEITQVSMTLSGILDVNFKVMSNGADMSKASIAITGAAAQTIESYTRDGDLYVYTAKVPAHKLPEAMTVSLVYDGAAVQTESWTAWSSYLSKLTGSNELTALAAALNSYGTYAAAYAAGTATEQISGITAAELTAYKPVVTVNGNLAAVAALYLDDAVDLRVKFNEDAWLDGYQLVIDGENAQAVSDGNGKLVYTKEGLLPQSWSHMYDIKVVSGEEIVYQVSYGVNSYVYQALKKETEAAVGLNNLLKSMYAYGEAAEAYAPGSKTPVALGSFFLRDPYILNDGDAYYLYGTRDNGSFNVWSSTDLSLWYDEGACLTLEPGDIYYDTTNSEIAFWAPEVYAYDGAYYMFATFTQMGTGNQQGTAVFKAESPLGPFEKWSEDVVTPWEHSCLDGTLYIENGVPYMIYCHEYQCAECDDDMGSMAYIQLSDDLKSAVSEPVELFNADQFSWGGFMGFGKKYTNVTDGCHVYTKDGVNYLQWSTSIDDVYTTVYTTFETLAGGVSGTHTKLYEDDGGHSMIFTDMNGVDKLILHTPNTATDSKPTRPALFNVTLTDGALGLEGVKVWDGYEIATAYGHGQNVINSNTTVFIGDSFFDVAFWNNFSVDLAGKDAKIFGISGSTVEDWIGYERNGALLDGSGTAPKNIVVNLGNNDYYNDGLTGEQALENAADYYSTLHENYPNANIYVFSTVARTGEYANANAAAQISEGNALLNTWCEDKDYITFIDITGLIPASGLYDGIHPNDEYYNTVYLAKLLEAGCVIEDMQNAQFYTQSNSASISVDNVGGTLTYAGADTTALYFMANAGETHAKNWEITGTITKQTASDSLFFSFGVQDSTGKDQWFCIIDNGFARQRYYNWFDTATYPDASTIYENTAQNSFYMKNNTVLKYKAVLNGDTLYVYFGNDTQALHLTWIIDLTDELYGGFAAGSSYQMALNTVDPCPMTISDVTVKTDNGAAAAADKFYVSGKSNDVFSDLIPDALAGEITYRGKGNTEIAFMANETETYAKNWEMTGRITKANASTSLFFSFGVKDSEGKEQWFCILNQSSIALQRYYNWYENRKLVDNVHVFNTPAGNAFFGDSVNTNSVLDYKVVLEGDVLKVYFGNDVNTMRLAWYLPLTEAAYGGFTAGSSYQLALNSVDPCPMTISNHLHRFERQHNYPQR